MTTQLVPSTIMQNGFGFWPAKTVLSAVELGLFTVLAEGPLSSSQVEARLALGSRAAYDFLDGLVALRLLERDGSGPEARYANTLDTATFLDANAPAYIGGIPEMANARLYPFWDGLTEAPRTGQPQNAIKATASSMFEELYADPERLEKFMAAMAGICAGNFHARAQFDFSAYQSVCDVGGATGQLSIILAQHHPHLRCTSFDLPVVEPIAERAIADAELTDRVEAVSGDFFAEALPGADVITMGMILHDWNLHLIRVAYDSLPPGGALIAVDIPLLLLHGELLSSCGFGCGATEPYSARPNTARGGPFLVREVHGHDALLARRPARSHHRARNAGVALRSCITSDGAAPSSAGQSPQARRLSHSSASYRCRVSGTPYSRWRGWPPSWQPLVERGGPFDHRVGVAQGSLRCCERRHNRGPSNAPDGRKKERVR